MKIDAREDPGSKVINLKNYDLQEMISRRGDAFVIIHQEEMMPLSMSSISSLHSLDSLEH